MDILNTIKNFVQTNEPSAVATALPLVGSVLRGIYPNAKPTMEADLVATGTALSKATVDGKAAAADLEALVADFK